MTDVIPTPLTTPLRDLFSSVFNWTKPEDVSIIAHALGSVAYARDPNDKEIIAIEVNELVNLSLIRGSAQAMSDIICDLQNDFTDLTEDDDTGDTVCLIAITSFGVFGYTQYQGGNPQMFFALPSPKSTHEAGHMIAGVANLIKEGV